MRRVASRSALAVGRGVFLSLLAVAIAVATARPAGAADGQRVLSYRVNHSVFGDIGTYTNQIQVSGSATTVHTIVHFKVSALGIGLHREDADRIEQWNGDRLMSFAGVTTKNGDTLQVKGQANGNNFLISSPSGTVTAPGTIRPANPWSPKVLTSNTMMRVDTGKIERVRISGGGETTVSINGAPVQAREYDITGSTRYKVWFDKQDVPVMFVVDDDSGTVTFTLKR